MAPAVSVKRLCGSRRDHEPKIIGLPVRISVRLSFCQSSRARSGFRTLSGLAAKGPNGGQPTSTKPFGCCSRCVRIWRTRKSLFCSDPEFGKEKRFMAVIETSGRTRAPPSSRPGQPPPPAKLHRRHRCRLQRLEPARRRARPCPIPCRLSVGAPIGRHFVRLV